VCGRNIAIDIKVTIVRQTIKLNLLYTLPTLINVFHDNFEEVGSFCLQKPSFRNKNAAMIIESNIQWSAEYINL